MRQTVESARRARRVGRRLARGLLGPLATAALSGAASCTTVDPGPNFVVPDETFDADYFYCHVEPEVLVAKKCGPGTPGLDPANGCHFNPSAVSGMALTDHPPINCGGGDHPIDRSQLGAAQSNLESASIEMSRDVTTAPIFLRPTGQNHPRQIFPPNDPVVAVLQTWAQK